MTATRTYGGIKAEDRRSARRAQLLEAGEQLLAEGGLEKLTVTGVCRQARLTERYFYESFGNREAMIDELLVHFATRGATEIFAAAARGSSPLERLELGIDTLIEMLTADSALGHLTGDLVESGSHIRHRRPFVQIVADLALPNAALIFGAAADERDDLRISVLFVIAGATEILFSWLDGSLEMGRDEAVRTIANLVATGGQALIE